MKVCRDKKCERAGQLLKPKEFPRNKTYTDGRHPYCKKCASRRMREGRARVKAMKQAQAKFGVERKPMRVSLKRDPLVEVYRAVENGNRTREEIQGATRLHYDVIGNNLALLIWEYRAVRIQGREFVVNSEMSEAA